MAAPHPQDLEALQDREGHFTLNNLIKRESAATPIRSAFYISGGRFL